MAEPSLTEAHRGARAPTGRRGLAEGRHAQRSVGRAALAAVWPCASAVSTPSALCTARPPPVPQTQSQEHHERQTEIPQHGEGGGTRPPTPRPEATPATPAPAGAAS